MSARKGFTLLELLIVIIIVAILAKLAFSSYLTFLKQGSAKAAQNNLITIYNAEKTNYFNNGSYCINTSSPPCDTRSDINTALNLNISDNNFNYTCTSTSGFSCTATNITAPNLSLTVTGGTASSPNPIILLGGTGCTASPWAAPCNPSCSSTNNPGYCPNN